MGEKAGEKFAQKNMKKNIGKFDRLWRITLSIVLIVLASKGLLQGWLGRISYIVALIFLATAIIRICPLYLPFGINTKSTHE